MSKPVTSQFVIDRVVLNVILCFFHSSFSWNTRNSEMSRKTIPSLPGYGSLELSWRLGRQYTEFNITVLIGFISCLLQLMYQVTKLHKGMAAKVFVL